MIWTVAMLVLLVLLGAWRHGDSRRPVVCTRAREKSATGSHASHRRRAGDVPADWTTAGPLVAARSARREFAASDELARPGR